VDPESKARAKTSFQKPDTIFIGKGQRHQLLANIISIAVHAIELT